MPPASALPLRLPDATAAAQAWRSLMRVSRRCGRAMAGPVLGLRVAGFQSQRYAKGLGAVVSYNRNVLRRVPVTLRLEAAALRHGDLPADDVDQLGLAVESIVNVPFKIDLFMRLGYGLYSSRDEEAGRLRSKLVLSRRF
ncbi:MAG: hypothetical protein GY856_45290 [bacterium]|nr:hypothetical protein [bacterium]